jgi:F-type H+-transporting ATPase subunit gamma
MSNLKEIKRRINSVKSTQQVTKAMKMVSAAKLRKAQLAIQKMRPYVKKVNQVISHLIEGEEKLSKHTFFKQRETKALLVVLISADRGLCGSFNSSIIRKTMDHIHDHISGDEDIRISFLCIGKKIYDYVPSSEITFPYIEKSTLKIIKEFRAKKLSQVYIAYNNFKNPAVYEHIVQQFLPIPVSEIHKTEGLETQYNPDYIYEPQRDKILEELLPLSLKVNFYRTVLESAAAEHGARMTSMDKASENANDILGELRLSYNKVRQATITKEILEITTGANALAKS